MRPWGHDYGAVGSASLFRISSVIWFAFPLRHCGVAADPETEALMRAYAQAVTRAMLRAYGISWVDACGDSGPLRAAREAGQSPSEFVRWWGEKHDLTPAPDPDLRVGD